MRRVVVTGAAGQLGSTIVARLGATCQVFPFTRGQLDIADERAVLEKMTALEPEVVINCAAYNDVDGAEEAAAAALSANALGVLALARAASASGARFVHYSTDFVFDGNSDRPYVETDAPRPLSTYGMSKLLGEWFALEAPSAYVLRVESLFGGQPAKSSVDKILAAMRAGQPVRVFADRTVSPSYVDDVASATEGLLATAPSFGIYHCVNCGTATWLDVAQEVARLLR
jgi:dTDP-4-dehydrorhamnose reductase